MTRTILAAAATGAARAGGSKAIEPMGTYRFVDGERRNLLDGDTSGFHAHGAGERRGEMLHRNVAPDVHVADARGDTHTIDRHGAVWTDAAGTRTRLPRG